MGFLKAPLAPLALGLFGLGVIASFALHFFVGLSLTALGAGLLAIRFDDRGDEPRQPPR